MIIFVLNRRYAPLRSHPADSVGVTGFVRTLIDECLIHDFPVSMVLFDRNGDKWCNRGAFESDEYICPTSVIPFCFDSDWELISRRFDECLGRFYHTKTWLYSQSGVYAPFISKHRAVFTHHGPFVSDVIDRMGASYATEAYGGGAKKIVALQRWQQAGLAELVRNSRFLSLEISHVQRQSVLRSGVVASRVEYLEPIAPHLPDAEPLPNIVMDWLASEAKIKVFSAAARSDRFKNLIEIAQACDHLNRAGTQVASLIAAGDASDADVLLRDIMDMNLGHRGVFITTRLRPGQLRSLFLEAAEIAPFAFPSTFDTLGLTPLQAKYHGCSVFCRDDKTNVGVASLLDAADLYDNGYVGLAARMSNWHVSRSTRLLDVESQAPKRGTASSILQAVMGWG